jgi:hypothetical protein
VSFTDGCGLALEAGPFSFGTSAGSHPRLFLNEVNRGFPLADALAAASWVEILNASLDEVALGGMFLSDERVNPRKVPLPDGLVVPAGGVVAIATSGPAGPYLSVDLPWARSAGRLDLVDSFERGSCILDSFSFDFGALGIADSLGRVPDGGDIEALATPSPGRSNSTLPSTFVRGDSTADGRVNISDVIRALSILFAGDERTPPCVDALDTNDDGEVNTTDPVYLANFLFRTGPLVPPPFPEPGVDPTPDALPSCASSGN